ncbi:xylulokinase [Muricomes intestini]|jgi:xylulokinase|uniref:Xylulose kinase n=1 Tax=Muricomes intestini TaxID=1796634 RepID=A0A4R3KER9_9FIRM|nr:xylulokinase [Muricomes intestini]TCS81630.1 xylulokinase [Muricomes intestini]HCR83815.1 xylulokinase [Lachnospiraceae bacterium]
MEQYLLGIDIGTSACKIAVFNREGKVIAAANGDYPVYYPHPGWAEQNPEEWWSAVCGAIKEIFDKGKVLPEQIKGVGIDGQSWSAIPVDREGNVLTNTPIWMDTRAADICEEMNEKIGADEIFQLSGNSLQPSYSTAKVIWYQRNLPRVYERIYKILQSNSYIALKLTGEFTQELSQGYGLHCFDMHTGTWDKEMCRRLGIPPEFLPDIHPCHEVIGTVTAKASGESGLAEGTPVVAGGLDAACGTLGAGVLHPGETQEQGGQAGGMSICTDTYKADPRLILSYHVIPGHWLLQGGTVGGGGVMRWLEKQFGDYEREEGKRQGKNSLTLFNEMAEKIAPGSDGVVFLPYMSGERSPIWDPNAKGVFYGLDFSKTKAHFIRSAMEGVAYSLKHNLDVAQEAGAKVSVLRSMGGSANSLLWTQIKADITGKPIIVPSSDTATTLGAVILAGVGVGMYKDFDEAVALTVENKRSHEPNLQNAEVYKANYQVYLEIYCNLKETMKRTGGR